MNEYLRAFLAVSFYAAFQTMYTVWLMWDEWFFIGGRWQRFGAWLRGRVARAWLRIQAKESSC